MSALCLILRGPSNCFKSTFASNFDSFSVVSLDDIRMSLVGSRSIFTEEFSVAYISSRIIESRLDAGINVVVDSTNIPAHTVKKIVDIAKARRAEILIYSFIRDIDSIIEGNQARYEATGGDTSLVSEALLKIQVDAYKEETPIIKNVYGDMFTEFNISNHEVSKVYNRLMNSY